MAREPLIKLKSVEGILLDQNAAAVDVVEHYDPIILSTIDFELKVRSRAPRNANAYSLGKAASFSGRDIVGRDFHDSYIPVQYFRIR